MYDPDVIAYLFPPEWQGRTGAERAINMRVNRSRFLPARRHNDPIRPAPESQSRFGREETEQPEEVDDLELLPCQVLRFSNPPKTRLGLVAGRSLQADLVLPRFIGTWTPRSEREEGQRGHGVAWSARGPSLVKGRVPVIKVVGKLQFRLVVPDHDITSQTYRDNVARFLEGAAPAEDLFLDIKITSRTRTELPTAGEAHTPSAQKPRRLFWKKELARGGFAVVHYVWDVTSRAEYALKEPLPGAGGDWKREAEIMKGICHVSILPHAGAFLAVLIGFSMQDKIVALRHASFDNGPQLYFEYIPGGSLDRYPSTTPGQRVQIAIQLLDGLTYLHDEKLVAHRDIKPANVLVQYWSPGRVHVKLGDFGLSKQSDQLKSFCGTAKYLAPEVFCTRLVPRRNSVRYDGLVDIWSLAVLLVKLECGELPQYRADYEDSGAAWGDVMVEFVGNQQRRRGTNDLLSLVLEDMLVVDPENRLPAKKCLEKALSLFGGGTSDDGEDSGEESNPSTPRALPADVTSSPNDAGASEASTLRLCPGEGEDNRRSSEPSRSRVAGPGSMSLIAGLGEEGSGFIDASLQMDPSDVSEFEGSDVPTPDTVQESSVVSNELWDAGATIGARGSAAGLEEGEGGGQRGFGSDSVGPGLGAAMIHRPADATREEDGPDATAVGWPSQRKRPRSRGGLGSRAARSSSKVTDQESEDGDSKRSRV
ncbi:MAG: hypothetical protein M1817_003670 [Caeruleum heppii]|nr:MAG: hypothetical protein M1817_003670 [Caeruleum heppii]